MNIPHDFSCHEGSKNVYFIEVRNLEGQNHPEHTGKRYGIMQELLLLYLNYYEGWPRLVVKKKLFSKFSFPVRDTKK